MLLFASLLGLGAWSYLRISRSLGEELIARSKADTALAIEARTREEMERLSVNLALDRGIALAEDHQLGPGLLWMLRGLELARPAPSACGGPPGRTCRPGSTSPSVRSSSFRPATGSREWSSAPTAGFWRRRVGGSLRLVGASDREFPGGVCIGPRAERFDFIGVVAAMTRGAIG